MIINLLNGIDEISLEKANRIIARISRETKIDVSVIIGKTKPEEVVIARQTAMYIIRISNPGISLKNIGKLFSNRDHATVIHSLKSIEVQYQTNRKFKENIRRICNDINPDLLNNLDDIGKKELEESRNKKIKALEIKANYISLNK